MDCADLINCLQKKFASLFEIYHLAFSSPTPKSSSDWEDETNPEVYTSQISCGFISIPLYLSTYGPLRNSSMTFRSSGCLQNGGWGSTVTPQAAQMIYSILSCECQGEEKDMSRKSCECMPFFPHFFYFHNFLWSDVKSQIGLSSLPPVYITELIKERMVIKKWWNGRGLWQEKLILFNKKDGGWGKKRIDRRKLTEEKRIGNEGAKPRAAAFTIHFHGWLAQRPKIRLKVWTWVFRYLFSYTWWHRIGLVFNSETLLLCPT